MTPTQDEYDEAKINTTKRKQQHQQNETNDSDENEE